MRVRAEGRCGFTLIELLVVIAIIAILVAMLLPAVQMVREAARKAQCQDHLHNVAIALMNYESSSRTLPIGARSHPNPAAPTSIGYGPSWWVGTLTYLEQGNAVKQFDYGSNCGFPVVNAANRALGNGLVIEVMRCPSSPLPETQIIGGAEHLQPSYVGIAGASDHWGLPVTDVNTCCTPTSGMNGQLAANGALITNRALRVAEFTDGLSNVMLLGEASNFSYDASGAKKRTDGAYPQSWMTGTAGTGYPPAFHPASATAKPAVYNLTTIRHSPNSLYNTAEGIRDSHGPNNPLSSAHPGGVQIALGDGVVRFVTENINRLVLQKVACRNDGLPTGAY